MRKTFLNKCVAYSCSIVYETIFHCHLQFRRKEKFSILNNMCLQDLLHHKSYTINWQFFLGCLQDSKEDHQWWDFWDTSILDLWVEKILFWPQSLFVFLEKLLWFNNVLVKEKYWRKCIFSPYILYFFYINHYILFLSFLIPKPIKTWQLSYYRQPPNQKS